MLIDLLREGAAEAPEQALVVAAGRELSWAACLERTDVLAAGLRARTMERFACQFDDVVELVSLLIAASASGAEACMYPPTASADAIRKFAAAFDHRELVTDRALESPPAIVRVDELAGAGSDAEEAAGEAPPDDAPVLILTTGTTGEPKAVRHEWGRLVRPLARRESRPGARWLLGYNLNQFAGIQVLLQVLVSRGTLVVPASRQPQDVAAALREQRVTHASGTPTFWRLLVGHLAGSAAADPALEQITIGGEAVPGPLLERLAATFPAAHVSQVYAANEFGTVVSVRDGRPGLPLSVLERSGDSDVALKIVDGELHARSRVGMVGYYGEAGVDDDWRPTGDLVEVRGDRIVFVGRTSEIINVGGVKVHPLPVEERVATVPGVALARVYGRPNAVTGNIVALDVVPAPGADLETLEQEVRAACADLPAAAQPRRIKIVDELDVRESKLARTAAS